VASGKPRRALLLSQTVRRILVAACAALVAVVGLAVPANAGSPVARACKPPTDWPMFGHDLGRSFATTDNCVTRRNAPTLRPKWFFSTGSPITAQPAISSGVAYVGAYNGRFYAVRVSNGKAAWPKSFNVHRYDTNITDFGTIPGSATVVTVGGRKVVIFGGGGTMFAVDARDGSLVAKMCVDRVDVTCRGGAGYTTEIESSPAVIVNGDASRAQVVFGLDVNEQSPAGPAGLVSLQFDGHQFTPDWWFDPEVGTTYRGLAPTQDVKHLTENGCNDVWSSPTIDRSVNMAFIGVGNCNHPDRVHRAPGVTKPSLNEATIGIDLATGAFRWEFTPRAPGNDLDLDFGATPNVLSPGVVGEGCKDGEYYAYEARTGKVLWHVKVAEASEIGGIIASTATGYFPDGHRAVFVASAIPVSPGKPGANANDLRFFPERAFGVHAIDATTHTVRWDAPAGPNYGAPIFSANMVFVPNTFTNTLMVISAENGVPLRVQPMNVPPAGPPAISGDSVILGTGITEAIPVLTQLSHLGGLWAFTTTV
jgi:outer membrane protein assembly factor BamB